MVISSSYLQSSFGLTHQGTRSEPDPQDAGLYLGPVKTSQQEHAGKFAPSMSLLSLCQLTVPGMIQDMQTCYTSRNTQDRAGQGSWICSPHLTKLHMAPSHFYLWIGVKALDSGLKFT